MISRVRANARVALLAAAFAVLGFGVAGYGVFGPVPPATAILETTSQTPFEIVPQPSPGVAPRGAAPTARPYDLAPLTSVLALASVGAAVLLIRRRRAGA